MLIYIYIYILFTRREVRIGKNCAPRSVLGKTVPEVLTSGGTQDRGHSFSQYGPKLHAKLRKKRGSKKAWVSRKAVALYGEKYLRYMTPDILT